jgi:hypothetical protein
MLCPKHGSSNELNRRESNQNRAQPKTLGPTEILQSEAEFEVWGSRSSTKMHKATIHDPHQQIRTQTPQNQRNKLRTKKPTKIARKRHENPTSYKWGIDPTIKVPFTRRSDSLQTEEKSNPMEQGNEKQSGWVVFLKTLELIYMSPFRARQKTTLPLVLKLWYNPLDVNRSRSTPFHRTTTPSPQTASFRRKPRDPATRPLASKLLGAPGSFSPHRASGLGFVAQPSNSTVLC